MTMADAVTIEIRGLDAIVHRLNAGTVQKFANEALGKSTVAVHTRLSEYTQTYPRGTGRVPPYIRTFTLKESIQFSVTPLGAAGTSGEGRIYTALDYAPAVIGHESQMAIHMGRWWTEQSVAEEMLPTVIGYFSEAMDKAGQEIAGVVI